MLRNIAAAVCGFLGWAVIAGVCDRLLRVLWPAYAAVEPSLAFTLGMMIARLLLAAIAALAGGYIAGLVSNGNQWPALAAGAFLLVLFIPVHKALWARFPVWYHLTFLLTIMPLMLLGTNLRPRART